MFRYQSIVLLALLAGQSAAFQVPQSNANKAALASSNLSDAPSNYRKLVPLDADGRLSGERDQQAAARAKMFEQRIYEKEQRQRMAREQMMREAQMARSANSAGISSKPVAETVVEAPTNAAPPAPVAASKENEEAARLREELKAAEAARMQAEEEAARAREEAAKSAEAAEIKAKKAAEEARMKAEAEEKERLARIKANEERIKATEVKKEEKNVPFFAADSESEPVTSEAESDYSKDWVRAGAFAASAMPSFADASAMTKDFQPVAKKEVAKKAEVVKPEEKQSLSLDFTKLDLSKVSNVYTPYEAFEALVQKGEFNAASSTTRILFSAALGGCYVGMGAMVSLAVAGNSPDLAAADPGLQKFLFAALFPMNLLLAQQCGGSLYTGNTANMMAALCEGRVKLSDMGRVLGLSWIGNVAGCGFFAIACKYAGVLEGGAGVLAAATLATKTSYELGPLLVKAMFCNWLVCLAVLLSTQAKDMGGKYISIWLPVSTFVSIGFEHSVANMFLLPAGLMSQDKISLNTALFHNLIPVTMGNAVSGALFVGAAMSYLYGSLGKTEEENIKAKALEAAEAAEAAK